MNCCLFDFYVGFINFLTEFRKISRIKPKLSVDLNFRVVSGFGELFEFPTSLNTLHLLFVSGVFFFFASSYNFLTHSIFCYNFSRVGLVTTRHETPGRGTCNIVLAVLIQDGGKSDSVKVLASAFT